MIITRRKSVVALAVLASLVLSSAGSRADNRDAGALGFLASKGSDSAQPLSDAEYQRIVKKIAEAIEDMKQALDRIAKGDDGSVDKQRDAERKLIEARNKLEELLRQLRQKELEHKLTDLINRCIRMLEMQEAVYRETKSLDKELQAAEDDLARKVVDQKSSDQSVAENKIVLECSRAIEILEAEGSTVAFPEAFRQLCKDMINVEARLKSTDVGVVTQNIEEDIIGTLKEMIEDLKIARRPVQPPGSGSPPPDNDPNKPRLMNQIAELKRLRSMQIRVNNRTKMYHEAYPTQEQLTPENAKDDKEKAKLVQIQKELHELGVNEAIIRKLTKDIAEGKNKP